jgi:hypothetical protein
LELLVSNEESLVSAGQQPALTTSLPFVHTARRTYRLSDSVKAPDCAGAATAPRGKLPEPRHLEEGEVVTRFP